MATTFKIYNNGAAINPQFSIKYELSDPNCVRPYYASPEYKDLVNVTSDELNQLREQIDLISPVKSDDLQGFAKEMKRLCQKYGVNGRLDTREITDYDDDNPSYMNFNGQRINKMEFGSFYVNLEIINNISAR